VRLLVSVSPPLAAGRHIVALHTAFEDTDTVHLMLDLCAGGDLLSVVSERGGLLPEPEAADLAAQLTDGSDTLGGGGSEARRGAGVDGWGWLREGRGVGARLGLGLGGGDLYTGRRIKWAFRPI
jgi:serine/threonine protein kinase